MKQTDILQRAKDHLEQIDKFVDPVTGQHLPDGSVLQAPSVHSQVFFMTKSLGWIIGYDSDQDRLAYTPDPARFRWVKPKQQDIGLSDMVKLLNWIGDMAASQGTGPRTLKAYLVDRGYLGRHLNDQGYPRSYFDDQGYLDSQDCLNDHGHLDKQRYLSVQRRAITPAGTQLGLLLVEHGPSFTLRFTPSAQQFLLDNADDLANYLNCAFPLLTDPKKKIWIRDRDLFQKQIRVAKALSQGLHPGTGRPLPAGDPATRKQIKTCFGYVAKALERALVLGYFSARAPFLMSQETWSRLSPSDQPLTLSEFRRFFPAEPDDPTATQRPRNLELVNILMVEGLLTEEKVQNNYAKYVPTPEGAAMGISGQEETNTAGEMFPPSITIPPAVQQLLIDRLKQLVQDGTDDQEQERPPVEQADMLQRGTGGQEQGRPPVTQVDMLQRAKDELDQINRFADPMTGQPLPADSVLLDRSVRRSLFLVSQSLGWIVVYDNDQDRSPFSPDPNLRRWIKPEQQSIDFGKMTKLLNWTSDMTASRGISAPILKAYLTDRGFLQSSDAGYAVAPAGTEIGLSVSGSALNFTPPAQQFLLDNVDDIADYCAVHYSTSTTPKKKNKVDRPDEFQDNIRVVKALSQGLHPDTGRPLPAGDPAAQEQMKTCFGHAASALERALELGYLSAKGPFRMSREMWKRLSPADQPLTLNGFLRFLSPKPADPTASLPLSAQELGDILVAEELMTREPTLKGRSQKLVPAPKGTAMGIAWQTMTQDDGETFDALMYPPAVQQLLIDRLEKFVQD